MSKSYSRWVLPSKLYYNTMLVAGIYFNTSGPLFYLIDNIQHGPFVAYTGRPSMRVAGGEFDGEELFEAAYEYNEQYCYVRRDIQLSYSYTLNAWVLGKHSEPVSWTDEDGNKQGDGWYQSKYLPDLDEPVEMTASGTFEGSPNATVSLYWTRREKEEYLGGGDDKFQGLYSVSKDDENGRMGIVQVGSERYKDNENYYFVQNFDEDGNIVYKGSGGTIHDDGDGWIIGHRNVSTWYEGTQPATDQSATFKPYILNEQGAKVPAPGKSNIVVTFDDYTLDKTPSTAYVTEVATWEE